MATELQQLSPIKGAKVLMVGAGGIGCELLKTLALSGFEDIHIATKYMVVLKNVMAVENNYLASIQIDMDTIEVSNLNRQFLFRQSHVGQSKAKVARDAVLRFRPHINITPYHANVKDPDFKVDFFRQFNVVLNGLDDLDARGHVNRLCLAASVPLIESGTTGFLGQVTVHVKGRTECYECQSKPAPKTYPVHNLELNQREQEGQLDEGFLSEVNAQLRQAKEDGDKPGLEAMLQKVYQLYASRVLSKRSYAKKGNEVLKAEQFLETLIQASEAEWNSILIDGLKIGKGDISPEELDGVIKKRIERTLIRTEGGSYQQRVLIEYLKGIQARAEDVVRVLQGKTR